MIESAVVRSIRQPLRNAAAALVLAAAVIAALTAADPLAGTVLRQGETGGVAKIVAQQQCDDTDLAAWQAGLVTSPGSTFPDPADGSMGGAIPVGFRPTAAYLCAVETTVVDADGLWDVISTDKYEGDLTELVAALNRPDAGDGSTGTPDNGTTYACATNLHAVSPLWLTDASGAAVQARWPLDRCGRTQLDGEVALAALGISESEALQRTLLTPRAALDTGCPGSSLAPYEFPTPAEIFPSMIEDATTVNWCRFTLDAADPANQQSSGGDYAVLSIGTGTFADGGTLSGTDAARVVDATVPPASVSLCNTGSTDFVTLADAATPESYGGGRVTVWLDGCADVAAGERSVSALPRDLTSLFE